MTTENNLLQTREEDGGMFERALVASEFIDWLLQEGEMGTRAEAEQLGRRLLEHGIVQHGEVTAHVTQGNKVQKTHRQTVPGQLCFGYHWQPVKRRRIFTLKHAGPLLDCRSLWWGLCFTWFSVTLSWPVMSRVTEWNTGNPRHQVRAHRCMSSFKITCTKCIYVHKYMYLHVLFTCIYLIPLIIIQTDLLLLLLKQKLSPFQNSKMTIKSSDCTHWPPTLGATCHFLERKQESNCFT